MDFNKHTKAKKVKKSPYLSHVSGISNTSSILDKMKSRLAENSEKNSVDIKIKRNSVDVTNELNFSKSHKFDFIKSETLGGLKNI